MNDDNPTGEVLPMIDRESLQGAPKRRSRAQWESRVKCELLHTGERQAPISLPCIGPPPMGNLVEV
jgi:hypothetical protein